MCHLCLLNSIFSRRRFLQLGLASLLTACTPRPETPLGHFAGVNTPLPETPYPDLAGVVKDISAGQLLLAGPVGEMPLTLTLKTIWKNSLGQATKKNELRPGEMAFVWLRPESEPTEAAVVQKIPAVGEPIEPMTALFQPEPTGETVPFGPFSLITRPGWGAAEKEWVIGGESGLYDAEHNPTGWRVYDQPLAQVLHTIVAHHSALDFTDGPRLIQQIHMRTAQFADIGYHFLIDGLGQLYEGRPLNTRGAHTGGHNTGYVGVCLLGNFEKITPVQTQLDSLSRLCRYLQQTYNIQTLGGHQDFQPGITACPGQFFRPELIATAQNLNLSWGQPASK